MCIVIWKPKGKKLDEIIYRNSFNRNDHGAGVSFVRDGKLVIRKGITKISQFLKIIQENEELEMLIHCRVMSKGEISADNCHPFRWTGDLNKQYEWAIAHNGTLPWRHTDKKSDTRCFVEDAFGPYIDRDPYMLETNFGLWMVGTAIGSSNKIAVMRHDKSNNECCVFIINRKEGMEYDGCWFSNLSFTDEFNRAVFDSDRKRMADWKPVLYKEREPVASGYGYGGWYGSECGGYQGVGGARDGVYDDDYLPWNNTGNSALKDWKNCPHGFGWYNTRPDFVGRRSLAERNRWLESRGITADPKEPKEKKETGPEDDNPPADVDLDKMEYLDEKEFKEARKACVILIKEGYPEFNLKGVSTIEIAAFARAELRNMPGFEAMGNEALMHFILYGDTNPAVRAK